MHIDDYIGLVVVLELDTMMTHEGFLEDAEGTHVKISNGEDVWVIPRNEILKITPIRAKKFMLK
ncbi:hypothetical protein BK133_11295 [Paenibacillus sp. FSL H8-0548]|uniref:hypothetical protein n=1 Tax=Paenibacillus sp. FSL H8-0548 TaxID=1920422 RepID=UPI00096E6B55|nr:hypothetical protein [Paenibacillus sp. FSL H8-0548]OMF35281.1 hypothetical protein BK133_11295 [Paenibacillus sp. FSL H8-0548]